ncbi:MAG: hypothetical protein AB1411_02270 [Nitrospirota bacterium]
MIHLIRQASEEMGKRNHLATGIALHRALAVLGELRRSLSGEIGFEGLCGTLQHELVRGYRERRVDRIEDVERILDELRSRDAARSGAAR